MSSLPVVSGAAAIRAFERAGGRRARQKGSHVSLIKTSFRCLHRGSDRGTLKKLVRVAGLAVDEFVGLLQ